MLSSDRGQNLRQIKTILQRYKKIRFQNYKKTKFQGYKDTRKIFYFIWPFAGL